MSNSKLEAQVEGYLKAKTEKPLYYDFTTNYFITNQITTEKIKSNFPTDKDIYKAKFSYSKDFWDNQNQLPLTNELEVFLNSVSDKNTKLKNMK